MGNIEDLTTAIRAALSTVAEGKTLTNQGRSAITDGTAVLTGISHGSTSYQLRAALDALSAAIQAAEKAEVAEAAVLDGLDTYVSQSSGGSSAPPQALKELKPAPQHRSRSPRGPDGKLDFRILAARAGITSEDITNRLTSRTKIPDFQPGKQNPACWQGLAPRKRGETARGNLFYPDGTQWNDKPLESGEGYSAFDAWMIRPEHRHLTPNQGHLEGNVAAWMSLPENQQRRMVLYLNEHPCDAEGQGCYDNVGHFLPKGYQLIVWSRSENRTWRRRVFDGTGKAFKARP